MIPSLYGAEMPTKLGTCWKSKHTLPSTMGISKCNMGRLINLTKHHNGCSLGLASLYERIEDEHVYTRQQSSPDPYIDLGKFHFICNATEFAEFAILKMMV